MNFEPVVMQKINPLVVVIQVLVGVEYLMFISVIILSPGGAYGFRSPDLEGSFAILTFAILGMSGLSYALRKIKQRDDVWLSLLVAVGLAPFVALVSSLLVNIVFASHSSSRIAVNPITIAYILGFILPFALIGVRLRNKYLQDES